MDSLEYLFVNVHTCRFPFCLNSYREIGIFTVTCKINAFDQIFAYTLTFIILQYLILLMGAKR